MAPVQQARLLVVVLSYAVIGYVHATGNAPGAIAVDDIYNGRLQGINVQAVFDMGGVTGYVQFSQTSPSDPVEIKVRLDGLDQYPDDYPWHVHDYPTRSGLLIDYHCSNLEVGGHYDPRNAIADPNYSTNCNINNATACEIGDFSNKLGFLQNDQPWQTFVDPNLNLYGSESIIGRSLVIHRGIPPQNRWICANIEYHGARVDVIRASIRGESQNYQGEVIIHKTAGRDDATIYVDVWRTGLDGPVDWNLRLGSSDATCIGFVSMTYGEESGADYTGCSETAQRRCAIGDFTSKCGPINFVDGRGRLFCTDNQLGSIRTSDLVNAQQTVSVVIEDGGAIHACGALKAVQPQVAYVELQGTRIRGQINFYQGSPNDRTYARAHITGLLRRNVSLAIYNDGDGTCNNLANLGLLRKPGSTQTIIGRPLGAVKTGDSVVLGNLSTKLIIPPESQSYRVTTSTSYLPLFGPYSIIGNTLAVLDANGNALACGSINQVSNTAGYAESILGYQN